MHRRCRYFVARAAIIHMGYGPTTGARDAVRSFEDLDALETALRQEISTSGAEAGFYYRSLAQNGASLLLAADLRVHAASTMKVPVMMQLYLDHQAGLRSLDSRVPVTAAFSSTVDGSSFDLPPESDSDTMFHAKVGEQVPVREILDRMITRSSNLATNILIEVADAERVTATLRSFGADSMEVLRGVEDLMAAEAGLPAGIRVANKTGWITGINHDAAVVFPEGSAPYVLVVLVRGHPAEDQGEALAAEISALVWAFHTGGSGDLAAARSPRAMHVG